MARFFLHAGHIQHRRDGFRYVTCQELANAHECHGDNVVPVHYHGEETLHGVEAGDVHLFPTTDGDYDLPTPNPED